MSASWQLYIEYLSVRFNLALTGVCRFHDFVTVSFDVDVSRPSLLYLSCTQYR